MPGDLALFMIAAGVLVLSVVGYQAAQHIKDGKLREAIDMGCKTAGSLAYFMLVNLNGSAGNTASAAVARAIEYGLQHVNHALPDALASLGVDTAPRLKVVKVAEPPKRSGGVKVETAQDLVASLKTAGVL